MATLRPIGYKWDPPAAYEYQPVRAELEPDAMVDLYESQNSSIE